MVITYHGDNYFKIQSGNFTTLIDPTDSRSFRGANLILNTLNPAPVLPPKNEASTFWVDHQGEYEVNGVRILGWSVYGGKGKEKTIYRLTLDSVNILIFGHLNQEPPKELEENFAGGDVVIIPAGGKPFISEAVAARLIRQIEPAVVIPSLFKDIKGFLKELGKTCLKEERLVFKAKDLKPGAMEVKCLR